MECHKCPNREKVENGEFAQLAYSDTPCAKCQLNENSELTMEFHVEMGDARTQDSGLRDQRENAAELEKVLPVSVMSEVVFRLLSLTPETRDVVCWRFAGMSYRDIAILQGVSVAAVEKRHWKAMTKWPALRAMFAMKTAKHARREAVSRSRNSEFRMNAKNPKGRRMDCEKRNG